MPFDLGYPPSRFVSSRPGYNGTSLQDVAKRFGSEDECFEHVWAQRSDAGSICTNCGKLGRWYRRRGAKHFQHSCGATISPLRGTLLHATKLPLRLWFYALLHFANSSEGVNAAFLGRQLGITYPAAFRMAYKIRLHLAALEALAEPISEGRDVHARLVTLHRARSGSQRPNTLNVLFVASDTRVDCAVLAAPRRHSVRAAIEKLMPGHGQVITTCYRTSQVLSAYKTRQPLATFVPTFFLDHPTERDLISGFLSYFLQPFKNHHKHASREYFWLYLKDFQFRYNRRDRSGDTYWDMVRSFPQLELQALQRRP